ncbi:MAG: hypothetical protein GY771_00490 [bacterium]|nr:hypothetical protein [bacterium]
MIQKLWQLIRAGLEAEMKDAQRDYDVSKGRLKEAAADYHFAMWLLSASASKKPTAFENPEELAGYVIDLIESAPENKDLAGAPRAKYVWLVKDRYKRVVGKDYTE